MPFDLISLTNQLPSYLSCTVLYKLVLVLAMINIRLAVYSDWVLVSSAIHWSFPAIVPGMRALREST